ncbi:hypothetical protein [Microvirga makkahensis]|uniref:Uncharacterized protein n=1 Tax=Microvirga makkahensis TaxID=1128670 RepID=A0A7X3SQX9_9HYPH|nr:hypothetical protein [Microvirga makkahensis]MXQ13758.1 hypothetical protein [Microvirga makkahensis]
MPSIGHDERSFSGWSALHGNASSLDVSAPGTADEFAEIVIAAICHASVAPSVGRRTFERCMRALMLGSASRSGFRHPAKAAAIDQIWREREQLFRDYTASSDKLRFLSTLPWIGPVTKHSLARRLGLYGEPRDKAVA